MDMSANNAKGYGPRVLFKTFDGSPTNYEIFEDSFMAGLRLLDLHLAFDRYSSERKEGFDLTKCKQIIYDHLVNCVDRVSHGIIKRGVRDDGVKALKLLR